MCMKSKVPGLLPGPAGEIYYSLGEDTQQKQPSVMLQQGTVCSDIPECIWYRGTY